MGSARATCGTLCFGTTDCPSGETCFYNLPLLSCQTSQPLCTNYEKAPPIFGKFTLPTVGKGFIPGYAGGTEITVDQYGIITIPAVPPFYGARLNSTFAARNGQVCADIKTPDVGTPGTVVAFYIISSHEDLYNGRPWWEVDFELMGKNLNQVWLSKFDNGVNDIWSGGYQDLSKPHNEWNRYCINWSIRVKCVQWVVNGKVIRSLPLPDSWTKPLKVSFSHWVASGSATKWAGGNGTISSRIEAQIKNIAFWRTT